MVDAWISDEAWMACAAPVDKMALRDRRCFLGLHVAPEMEFVSICAVFLPVADGEPWKMYWDFFGSTEYLRDRERLDCVPYSTWLEGGFLKPLEGGSWAYDRVIRGVLEFTSLHEVIEIAYDPWNAQEIVAELSERGYPLVPIRQSYSSMSGYTVSFERIILARNLVHNNDPVARWMMACTEVKYDRQDNLMPMTPQRNRDGKRTDGIVAAIMALGRASLREMPLSIRLPSHQFDLSLQAHDREGDRYLFECSGEVRIQVQQHSRDLRK